MKTTTRPSIADPSHMLDIRQPEQAARLQEVVIRERDSALAALAELETVRYASHDSREATALATMEPMPDHALMDRAPREILRMRASLVLVQSHAHRRN